MNLMNMGKSTLYNVRCTLNAPGLIPQGSAYIGNMDPGTSKSGDLYVFIGTKDMTPTTDAATPTAEAATATEEVPTATGEAATATGESTANTSAPDNSNQYGPTQGKITISYEDEYGKQYSQDIDIATTIGRL